MPNRYLREGILESDRVNSLSFEAEVFYRRLMSVVDDFGRFDGRTSILKGRLYALKPNVRETDISHWIAACVKAGLIALYQSDGKPYLLFHRLGERRALKSKFPEPPVGVGDRLNENDGSCWHMLADENICLQTQTNAPPSSSSSIPPTPSIKEDPPTPQGGDDQKSRKRPAAARSPKALAETVPIPECLLDDDFRAAWGDWLADRRERGKPMTSRAAEQQLKKLIPLGTTLAAQCVRDSIAGGWLGVFPEKYTGPAKAPPRTFRQTDRDEAFALLDAMTDKTPAITEGESDAA